jgi:hypothetical protein
MGPRLLVSPHAPTHRRATLKKYGLPLRLLEHMAVCYFHQTMLAGATTAIGGPDPAVTMDPDIRSLTMANAPQKMSIEASRVFKAGR